jgi:hypothetical protein
VLVIFETMFSACYLWNWEREHSISRSAKEERIYYTVRKWEICYQEAFRRCSQSYKHSFKQNLQVLYSFISHHFVILDVVVENSFTNLLLHLTLYNMTFSNKFICFAQRLEIYLAPVDFYIFVVTPKRLDGCRSPQQLMSTCMHCPSNQIEMGVQPLE